MPTTAPPNGRINNTAVYDSGSDRLIVFGGSNSATCCTPTNDVWVLTNAAGHGGSRAWINLSPAHAGPLPTEAASAVYDPSTNRMIVFGGQVNGSSSSQLWILEHANGLGGAPDWIAVTPEITPPPRQNHQAVYDPATHSMIVFGGLENLPNLPLTLLNDVWVLENVNGPPGAMNWMPLPVSGTSGKWPVPRHSMAAAYDSAHNRLLIFGGCTDATWGCGSTSTELWALDNANGAGTSPPSWTSLSPTGNPPVADAQYASTAYVASSNNWIVMGGRVGPGPDGSYGTFDNETWVLVNANGLGTSPQWAMLTPGNSPAPRGQSVSPSLYDPVARRFIVFGGPGLNDTWTMSFR